MKERLTGAIILVAVIVLLVPELLSGPKGRSASTPAGFASSASEELPLRSYTINLGDESRSHGAAAGNNGPPTPQPGGAEQSVAPTGEPQSAAVQPAASQQAPSQEPAPQPPPPQITPPKPEASPPHESKSAGASAPASKSPVASAPLSKPPATSGSASKQLKAAQHSKAASAAVASNSATAKPNKAAAPASKPESGWAVQLGVFSSRANAERLALEVRVKGFKVTVSPMTSGSRKRYRVRVGPTADRAAAQDLQARLKAAGRPAGTVVPYS